jgi:hypothetical protein
MKNKFKILGIIALVAVMVTVAGCATNSSIGGTADPHGFLVSSANSARMGGVEIASYGIILGLFDAGYPAYAQAVKAADAAGKQITTVTTWYFGIYVKVTAYAQ